MKHEEQMTFASTGFERFSRPTKRAAFLTEIIWSGKLREEEIKRVVRAAFGSLAVFITPSEQGQEATTKA